MLRKPLFLILLLGVILLVLNRCKTSSKTTSTPPNISLQSSFSYVYVPHKSQEYSYAVSFKADTSKNFSFSYIGMGQNPIIETISGQYKVLQDSSFELVKGLLVKQINEKLFLRISEEDSLSTFLKGEYILENMKISNTNEKEALMGIAGYSMVFTSKDNTTQYVASEYGKIFELENGLKNEYDLNLKSSFLSEGFYHLGSFDGKFNLKANIQEGLNYIYPANTSVEGRKIEGSLKIIMPQILINGNWQLEEIEGKSVKEFKFPNSKPIINFSGNGQRLIGVNGCNQIFGSLNYVGNTFKWMGNLGSTKMFCEGTDDNLFTEKLNNANNFQTNGSVLELYENNNRVLTFSKKAETLEK